MTECRCGKPTRDTATVCRDCILQLETDLCSVPWLDEQGTIALTKQRGIDYSALGGKGAEIPSPSNGRAAKPLANLRALLVTWVRLCHEEAVHFRRPIALHGPTCAACSHVSCSLVARVARVRSGDLPDDNLPAMARWLMLRLDGIAHHDAGCDVVDQLHAAVLRCHDVVDLPPDREYVGPCPECSEDLYREPESSSWVRCGRCGEQHDGHQVTDRLNGELDGRLVTANMGARMLGFLGMEIPQKTIDKWHERGRVVDRGHDHKGRRVYNFSELRKLAEVTRAGARGA